MRVISTILNPSGEAVAKATSTPVQVLDSEERSFEQRVSVAGPALWSLEERNLYTLLTEIQVGGVDRRSLPNTLWHTVIAFRCGSGILSEWQAGQRSRAPAITRTTLAWGWRFPMRLHQFRVRTLQGMAATPIAARIIRRRRTVGCMR